MGKSGKDTKEGTSKRYHKSSFRGNAKKPTLLLPICNNNKLDGVKKVSGTLSSPHYAFIQFLMVMLNTVFLG